MRPGHLATLSILGALLSACTTAPGPAAGTDGAIYGYRYYDANHPNGLSQASPQAIYNATHGVWLWPPAVTGRPG
jgi:hypothetical protein